MRKDFDVTEITGWHIEYVNNQVRYRRTITKNLLTARKTAASVAHHRLKTNFILERIAEQEKIVAIAVRLGDHHHRRVRQRSPSEHQQLEHVVERR